MAKYLDSNGLSTLWNRIKSLFNTMWEQSDWNESSSSSKAYIKNKPTIPSLNVDIIPLACTLSNDETTITINSDAGDTAQTAVAAAIAASPNKEAIVRLYASANRIWYITMSKTGAGSGYMGMAIFDTNGKKFVVLNMTSSHPSATIVSMAQAGGTSSQFIKGDGSYDSTTYATAASVPIATTTTPKMDGTAAVGSETKWAKGDHVHPTDTSRAPIASPTFTGTVTLPTVGSSPSDNTAATVKYVNDAVAAKSGVAYISGTPGSLTDATHGAAIWAALQANQIPIIYGASSTKGHSLVIADTGGGYWAGSCVCNDKLEYVTGYQDTIGVQSELAVPMASSTTPLMDGTAAVGSETTWAKGDHVHPTDTSRAPVSHASSSTTYGKGTNSDYGHVKLSDSTSSTTAASSGGTAATPKAVKDALDAAKAYADAKVTGATAFQGTTDLADDAAPTADHWRFADLDAYTKGWYWVVKTAGTYANIPCEVGDFIFCVENYDAEKHASGSTAWYSDFSAVQNNIETLTTAEVEALTPLS